MLSKFQNNIFIFVLNSYCQNQKDKYSTSHALLLTFPSIFCYALREQFKSQEQRQQRAGMKCATLISTES